MFTLCRFQNYVLVTILWMCIHSVRSCDELVHICVQLRTNNYQHVPTKKIGWRTYCVQCTCIRAFTRSSQVRHKSATSRNIVSRVDLQKASQKDRKTKRRFQTKISLTEFFLRLINNYG
jgi:hypothetical protein